MEKSENAEGKERDTTPKKNTEEKSCSNKEKSPSEETEYQSEETSPPQNTGVKVIYGEWQEGKFMEEDFWEKYLEKRRQEIEEEEENRRNRIEKANREEKSWELGL